jgi:hypothetical protein
MNAATESFDSRFLHGDFSSDLWFPRYRETDFGGWSLRFLPMSGTRGYWGDYYRINGTVLLSGPEARSWMSMLPTEVEALEIGIRAAHDHTVVMGLGMGWVAANCALRSEVRRVTVIERDADVIALVRLLDVFGQLPQEAREKLHIVEADALEWKSREPVDMLHADIWERLIDDDKLDHMRRIQDNARASAIYFWGQEAELWRAACRRAGGSPALDQSLVTEVIRDDLALPLIVPDWPNYPHRIAEGAKYWSAGEPDWWR